MKTIIAALFIATRLAAAAQGAEPIPPEAEVSAVTKPVKLTLRLYKTKIKAGEFLWQQVALQNVGTEEMIVFDHVFKDPTELRVNTLKHQGIYIDIIGPDGKRLDVELPRERPQFSDEELRSSGGLDIDGPKEQAMVDAWKRSGLTPTEVSEKLISYNSRKREHAALERQPPPETLMPGARIETKSWFENGKYDALHHIPRAEPIGNFARLEFFDLRTPGKYKVRAVYDYHPDMALKRKYHSDIFPGQVMVRTPWISVVVAP